MAHAFILTDVAGEHAWRRGNWFVPLEELDGDDQQVTIFRTKRAAQEEVRRQRKRDGHLRVQRIELLPVWPRSSRTLLVDDPTMTTFAYSRSGLPLPEQERPLQNIGRRENGARKQQRVTRSRRIKDLAS